MVCLVVLGVGFAGSARGADVNLPDVSFARQADVELLSWNQILPELAEQDPTPTLTVYGDGRVVVYQPFYMKRSGRYEMQLSDQALNDLLGEIAAALIDFDAREVSQLKRETVDLEFAAAEDWRDLRMVHHADADTSVFRLALDAWRPPGAQSWAALDPLERKWTALRFDAREYPDIEVLQAMDQAEKRLRALTRHDDLVRVGEAIP